MGYAKERGKLEKLSAKMTALTGYDDKNLKVITDVYEQYSHTVRILKNKDSDSFNALYENDLQQIKECKRSLKLSEEDEVRQAVFVKYKDTLLVAIEKTIEATKASV